MASEEIFRDLCENAHDLIQSVSPEGHFLYVNRSWLKTLGYELEETVDLNVFDVIHPDSREHCAKLMQRVMAGQAAEIVEAVFVAKDGLTSDGRGDSKLSGPVGCRVTRCTIKFPAQRR